MTDIIAVLYYLAEIGPYHFRDFLDGGAIHAAAFFGLSSGKR